ncbi:MAG: ribbon-helix-helix domain-containing protein [Desulfurococcales archaeon]|nr:ribbon-helix-helix domain-containing protein [Desulfurococcales archaeon]
MRLITVKMPEIYVNGIDELVKAGRYSSRSEAIRIAVRELLKRELWGHLGEPYSVTARYENLETPFSFAQDEGVVDLV